MPEIRRTGSHALATLAVAVAVAVAVGCGGTSEGGGGGGGGRPDAGGPPGAPVIVAFEATPARLPYGGGDVAVTWTVTGATTVELQGMSVAGTSATVAVERSVVLELRARGPGGEATATREVIVETTVTVSGRVTDERGSPLGNVTYVVLEDPRRVGFSTYDDGTFSVPIRDIVPPYTICLNSPTTCYVGLTRADPVLVMWRNSQAPRTTYGVSGDLRRSDAAAFSTFSLLMAVDGPGTSQGSTSGQGTVTSTPYAVGLLLAPRAPAPVARVWAVLQDGASAAVGQTGDIALVEDTTLPGHDLVMAPVATRSVQVTVSGPYAPESHGVIAGLVLPRGGKLSLPGAGGQFAVPAAAGARLFATASAFQPGTLTPFSTATKVGDIVAGTVALDLPPVPVILSPQIGSRITPDSEFSWTPLPGAIYRVRFAAGVQSTEVVVAQPSATLPALPPGWGVNCSLASCSVAVDTFGGIPSLDVATGGALHDVLRGARSGSVTPGPPIRFSN